MLLEGKVLLDAVEHERAFNSYLEFASPFLELPGVQPAVGWQAQTMASVADQVLRGFGGDRRAK